MTRTRKPRHWSTPSWTNNLTLVHKGKCTSHIRRERARSRIEAFYRFSRRSGHVSENWRPSCTWIQRGRWHLFASNLLSVYHTSKKESDPEARIRMWMASPRTNIRAPNALPTGRWSGLLIGLNCPRAIKPLEVIPGKDNDPYAKRTALGWGIIGLVSLMVNTMIPKTSATSIAIVSSAAKSKHRQIEGCVILHWRRKQRKY